MEDYQNKDNISRNYFDLFEKKLAAESSIGILATLIAGFSISALPNINNNNDECKCPLWESETNYIFNETLMWLSSIFLSLTSVLSIIAIFYSSGLFWLGMKKISLREYKNEKLDNQIMLETEMKEMNSLNHMVLKQNLYNRVDTLTELNKWWKEEKLSRKRIRKLFVATFLFFTTGFILMPSIWCNNCILGMILFMIFLIGNICVIILSNKFILLDKVKK